MTEQRTAIKDVCKTLPVSYYVKRPISVEFNEYEMSAYDPFKDELHISVKQIEDAIKQLDVSCYDDFELGCRSNFYHEVSHALLTPENIFDYARVADPLGSRGKDVLNIFEDERIETLLNSYYINVDFKKSVFALNHELIVNEPTNEYSAFFKLVRFRMHDRPDFVRRVQEIIMRHAKLSRASSRFSELHAYAYDIARLFNDVRDDFKQKQQSKKNDERPGDEDMKSNGSDASQEDQSNSAGNQPSQDQSEAEEPRDGNAPDAQRQLTQEEIEQAVSEALKHAEEEIKGCGAGEVGSQVIESSVQKNELADNACYEKLRKIVMGSKLRSKQNAAAINGWSGVIEPRLTDRNDARFFVQKSRAGHLKRDSKLHLTFIQDVSGSYTDDVFPTNQLFYALKQLENEMHDFSFDVVAVNHQLNVLPRDRRCIRANGGTKLSEEIFDIVRQMRKPDAVNKFIVLFDGECGHEEYFRAFNSKDFSIIYENENAEAVERYCSDARKRYVSGEFSKNLKEVAVSVIEEMLR